VDGPDNVQIRRSGEKAAQGMTPAELADQVEAEAQRCREELAGLPEDHVVDYGGDYSLRLEDFLLTRVLELVVHSDDLAVSLGTATPEMPAAVNEATVRLLAALAVDRHGALPVVRALSRRERAPETVSAF
jgi:hypothetical protein